MFVAQELRKKSIAEYLLYMWQIEDIIRAYGCSLPVIKREYIGRFNYSDEQRSEEIDWFGNLVRMMNEEGKREYGHLQINEVLLGDVVDLHEIETCLDALYGILMLRLQKKEISPETERAIKEITTFVGLLSDYYIKDNTEGLKFEDD